MLERAEGREVQELIGPHVAHSDAEMLPNLPPNYPRLHATLALLMITGIVIFTSTILSPGCPLARKRPGAEA